MTTKSNPDESKTTTTETKGTRRGAHTGEIGDVNEFPEWQNDPALEERMDLDAQAEEDALREEMPERTNAEQKRV
jgi:hypothetical protein